MEPTFFSSSLPFVVFRQPFLWEQVTTEEKEKNAETKICTSWDIKSCSASRLHCLTGCDTCGHIKGIGKKDCLQGLH